MSRPPYGPAPDETGPHTPDGDTPAIDTPAIDDPATDSSDSGGPGSSDPDSSGQNSDGSDSDGSDSDGSDSDDADSGRSPSRFGRPGAPLQRSPFFSAFTAGLGLALAYVLFISVTHVWSVLLLVAVSAFIAVGLHPAVVRLQRMGLPRGLAVFAVALGTLLVVVGAFVALVPPIVRQGGALADALPGYLDSLKRNQVLNDLNDQYDLIGRIKSGLTGSNTATAVGGVLGGVTVVFSTLFNLITGLVLTFYFLAAFNRLSEGAYRLVPRSRRTRARLIGDEILSRVGGYVVGALMIAGIAGTTSLIFMLVTGIPYPFALALVVAILDLIPQIGASLGAVVVTLVAFFVSIPVGIASIVFFVAYQQLENWIIYPRVMRRSVNVSDLAAIVSVLIGASLLGVVGALLAIPACAAVQLIVREVVLPRQDTV